MTGPARTSEWSVALFLLGILAVTPPILTIFDAPDPTFGLPSLYLYLFVAWGVLIVLVGLVAGHSEAEAERPGAANEGQER